jgi:hypothetical protein
MQTTSRVVGANARIRWKDTGEYRSVFVLFAADNGDDDDVFYYFPEGEKEMRSYDDEWVVVSYETVSVTDYEGGK